MYTMSSGHVFRNIWQCGGRRLPALRCRYVFNSNGVIEPQYLYKLPGRDFFRHDRKCCRIKL